MTPTSPSVLPLRRAIALIACARPHLLVPALAAALTGYHWAGVGSIGADCPQRAAAAPLAIWSLALAASHLVNLAADLRSDEWNAKNRFRRGLIPGPALWTAGAVAAAGSLALALPHPAPLPVAVVLTLLLGALYSLPPARWSRDWAGGIVVHWAGYAAVAPVLGAGLRGGRPPLPAYAYLAAAVTAGYLLSTVLDREGDAREGKITAAVRFGPHATLLAAAISMAALVVLGMATAPEPAGRIVSATLGAIGLACTGAAMASPATARRLIVIAIFAAVAAAGAPGLVACPVAAALLATVGTLGYGWMALAVRLGPRI